MFLSLAGEDLVQHLSFLWKSTGYLRRRGSKRRSRRRRQENKEKEKEDVGRGTRKKFSTARGSETETQCDLIYGTIAGIEVYYAKRPANCTTNVDAWQGLLVLVPLSFG